jgi:transcriptional regulator with XRE-family HTH domain
MMLEDQMTDEAFLREVGARLEQLRLRQNLIRADLAEQAGISRSTLERIEAGESVQLVNLVRLCRALGILNLFEKAFPVPQASPLAQLRLQKKMRQRASRKRAQPVKPWTWGDSE